MLTSIHLSGMYQGHYILPLLFIFCNNEIYTFPNDIMERKSLTIMCFTGGRTKWRMPPPEAWAAGPSPAAPMAPSLHRLEEMIQDHRAWLWCFAFNTNLPLLVLF